MKINKLIISRFRGIKEEIELNLNQNSILIYGDNGTGKSSISDALEWFYFDKVDHLSDDEIGRKGYEALRNISISDSQDASVEVLLTEHKLDNKKSLTIVREKLKADVINKSSDFNEYIESSTSEALILRYKDLANFVLSTKNDKLKAISDIIGYSDITKTKDALKSAYNALSKEMSTAAFEGQINHHQSQIIEQLDQNIVSDRQFIALTNERIRQFETGIIAETLDDIDLQLSAISSPNEAKEFVQEGFLEKVLVKLTILRPNVSELQKAYELFKECFDEIGSNTQNIKNLMFDNLLTYGQNILQDENYSEDNCPLCLAPQSRDSLLGAIGLRLEALSAIKIQKATHERLKSALQEQLNKTNSLITTIQEDDQSKYEDNSKILSNFKSLGNHLELIQVEINRGFDNAEKLAEWSLVESTDPIINSIKLDTERMLEKLRDARKTNPKWDIATKLKIAKAAYKEIKKLRSEAAKFDTQKETLRLVLSEFQAKQKEALEEFLNHFSQKINEVYSFMNPLEKVEKIRLVPMEKDGELSGITIEFDFLENKNISPPHKYLSESHLNCLGIAFFLTSVEAFNHRNKFIVLDDVISSFDSNHRMRFANLLIEKFSSYQIILLTHESSWFELIKSVVQGKKWIVKEVKHSEELGTHIEESSETLKAMIRKKLIAGEFGNLANDSRSYLEHILKQIAFNLELKVSFRFNNRNEDRMSAELLDSLIGKLDKVANSKMLIDAVKRVSASLFIGNKESHDSKFEPSAGDKKAFWDDIIALESLLCCENCAQFVSVANFNLAQKSISCKCGTLSYNWKK